VTPRFNPEFGRPAMWALPNRLDTNYQHMKFREMLVKFCGISQTFCKISYFSQNFTKILHCKIFFPTSHTLYDYIEHIKLKLLLSRKLYSNFAIRNFAKISQHFAKKIGQFWKLRTFRQNFVFSVAHWL
jgi:hypothetical protein